MGIKDFFRKLRQLWKIPKFKGLIQLIFWIIFFLIIAIIFRSVENRKIQQTTIENEEKIVNSYEYNYQYTDFSNTINISGTNYQNQEVFYINNNKFYYVNNNYYNALDNSLITMNYALSEWSYNSLKNVMDKNNYSNKIEYKNNTIKYEYNIDYSIYNNYYNTNYSNNILITTILEDGFINSAIINYGFASVNISYTNINKLKSLDINID